MGQILFNSTLDSKIPAVVVVFKKDDGLMWAQAQEGFPKDVLTRAKEDGLKGSTGSTLLIRPDQGKPAARLLLVGAGSRKEADLHVLRRLAAKAAHWALEAKPKALAFLVPNELGSYVEEAQAIVEGLILGGYRFQKHQSKAEPVALPPKILLVGPAVARKSIEEGIRRGEIFAQAANFSRDLINEPPSLKTPETLGRIAKSLAGKGIRATVFNKAQLKRLKMNALLGVNRGSAHPPVLVHLHYKPVGRARKRIAIVGKGITFDSGGLSLKTADGMMTMKYDMAGSSIVFGVFQALAKLRPDVEVHGIAPITENMPGHDAYKPGDVVRAYNGKSIEVLNTDAEGRVVLSDALSYAAKLPVDEIIDAATLTGAATIALGRSYAALMSNNQSLVDRLQSAAEKSGEKMWRLPLEPAYRDHIRSKVADLKNIGNAGEAGTIIGGLFLEEFVDGKPWAHLDIASCGWSGDGAVWGAPGAVGVMVRTFLHHILN